MTTRRFYRYLAGVVLILLVVLFQVAVLQLQLESYPTSYSRSSMMAAFMRGNVSSVFEIPEDELWLPVRVSSSLRKQEQKKTTSLSSSCPYNVSFYVYENLPRNLTTFYENITRREILNAGENVQTEWILLQLFRTSPCRIYNASLADYFFVPYMHVAHCVFKEGYFQFCNQVPDSEMNDLFESLQYYNPVTKDNHIFIKMHDAHSTKRQMRSPPLQLTTGPRRSQRNIPLPLFHPDIRYQPSLLLDNSIYNISWWTRPRKYAFSAFYGGLNPRMRPKWKQPRRFRLYFDKEVREAYPPTIAGLPYFFRMIGPKTERIDFFEAYRDSVLCPILPGDNCWQRRFFDVIRNGCLPVVLEWPIQGGDNRSWHTAEPQCPVVDTYPFARGQFRNMNSALEIDYDSFVVRAQGNLEDESNVTSILKAMQDVLASPEEVARRQQQMMSYLPLFTYGIGQDSHMYNDGFSRVMEILQHFSSLDTID